MPAGANGAKIGTITVTIAQDTNITAAEVTALKVAAMGRQTAWENAGYEDDARYLVNSIVDLESAAINGVVAQNILNSEYARLLATYNEMEAKVNG